jgi:hypothetical protein
MASALAGIEAASAGMHRNGLPDFANTGLNLPSWIFSHE